MGPNTQHQVHLSVGAGLALQTPADKLFWSPVVPTKILMIVATVTTALTSADNAILEFDRRPAAGSDAGRSAALDTLEIAGAQAAGKACYVKLDPQPTFLPGEELVVQLANASAAGAAHIDMWVEPAWEEPANNANMVVTVS